MKEYKCKNCGEIVEYNGIGFEPIIHTPSVDEKGNVEVCGEFNIINK